MRSFKFHKKLPLATSYSEDNESAQADFSSPLLSLPFPYAFNPPVPVELFELFV